MNDDVHIETSSMRTSIDGTGGIGTSHDAPVKEGAKGKGLFDA